MNQSTLNAPPACAADGDLANLVEELTARLEAGESVDLDTYLEEHPEHGAELRRLYPALRLLTEDSGKREAPGPAAGIGGEERVSSLSELGDFRLLREVGRGGMGLVYEAEQRSLGRRVAVKVLPWAATLDAKQLQRFQNEAHAAAQLHHTHIVPVYYVGCERGVPFYAMQFIDGHSLAALIGELRQQAEDRGSRIEDRGSEGTAAELGKEAGSPALVAVSTPQPPEATLPAPSSILDSRSSIFFDTVAQLGAQAAEALAHAHEQGVVHRDIKPANLLVDGRGHLWITDFGLAQVQSDPRLTATGDLVGTLRYMSPEQALAQRARIDQRTDVYSLGVTLYEVLTLEPAFPGRDRQELLRQITTEEPRPPRRCNPAIPADLETICLKAMAKEPGDRYQTADGLAEDLRRFLAGQPIRARPLSPVERLWRWGRRNPLVAGLTAAVLMVAAAGFLGVFGQWQVALANEQQANANAAEAKEKEHDANQQRDEARALAEKLQAALEQLRRTTYAAHMNLAKHAWEEKGGVGRVLELLEQHRPKAGEPDLRGFEWHYLHRLCHSDLLTLKGHTEQVNSVAYSPDGKRLASASGDLTVKVWDAQTGQELLSLKGHTSWVRSVAFSPDGKRLASGSGGVESGSQKGFPGELKVWDAQTGQELLALKGLTGDVSSVAYSPDGKRLASAPYDETATAYSVKVWDAQTGQELLAFKGQTDWVSGVTFSPDGKRLASSDENGTVKVWDAQTGRELLTLKGGSDSVAFSPDGKRLAGAGKVWDAQTGQELLSLKGSGGSVAFSPDGKRLASSSGETLRIWDLQTGQEIRTLKGHTGNVNSVAFSPDGRRLASSSADKTVKVWDAQKDLENLTLQADVEQSVAFSLDFRRLASTSADNTVKVWDAQTGQQTLTLKGHTAPIWSVAFSPDGKRLASGGGGHRSPAGSLGTSDEDRAELKVWDAQTGQELLTLQVSNGFVWSVAFSPDGKRLAGAYGYPPIPSGQVKVWEAQTGQELLSLKGHTGPVSSVAFSPDGKRLASASFRDGTVKVWDAQTGQELFTLKGPTGWGPGVAFSPDGKRLASASKVWDAQTGQELFTLRGSGVVAFSPDGKRLASAGGGGVKVWDAQTGQELLSLKDGRGSVAFSPDGHRLAGSGPDGTVKIWDATPLPEKRTEGPR